MTYLGNDTNPYLVLISLNGYSFEGVHPDCKVIAGYAYMSNYDEEIIVIPSNITSISQYTFSNYYSITTIILSNNITNIEKYAFDYCTSIQKVYFTGSEEEFKNIAIDNEGNDYFINAEFIFNYIV